MKTPDDNSVANSIPKSDKMKGSKEWDRLFARKSICAQIRTIIRKLYMLLRGQL